MEPLGPTVVLARTNRICPLGTLIRPSAWLTVSTTLVAMAPLRLRGPLTVTVYRFGERFLASFKCIDGRLSVLTPIIVILAMELTLIMPFLKA